MDGKTLEAAGAAAGMSERSARTWKDGPMPSERVRIRDWRTRPDPFAAVWDDEIVPLLRADERGVLQGTTVIALLMERHPDEYELGQVRTLQRRMRDWRALHGPEREVFFPQEHPPGREAAADFTDMSEVGVTIGGEVLDHLLYQLVLSASGWRYFDVAFGETYEALLVGTQDAFFELGGVTEVYRTDNLSAATHELRRTGGRALTTRFRGLLDHFGLRSTRIQPGESHENGVVEQAHHRTKIAIKEALVLRGSRDFETLAAYRAFLREVRGRMNRAVEAALADERPRLKPLPTTRLPGYSTYHPRVSRWSTIRLGGRSYSVPSRLIGHVVEVRQHPDHVDVYYTGQLAETLPRLRGERDVRIDYRHVIWSLVRKPGAFARYRWREELFPSTTFRRAFDALRATRGDRAEVEYLRILHLAASTMESTVEAALVGLLERGEPCDYLAVQAIASPRRSSPPIVSIPAPDLRAYDALLIGGAR
jgi:hypothetical protein